MSAPVFAVVADPPPPRRYRLLTADDLARRPTPRSLIKGVFPATGIAALIGQSSAGKSFLGVDICAAVDRGGVWFGYRVTQRPVAYLALEGQDGLGKRVAAYQLATGSTLSDRFRIITEPFAFLDVRDVPDLADTLTEAGMVHGLVVIDTLNRAAAGADENSSTDMGLLIAAATELQRRVGGLVLIVHHTGKDATKGARGHSSLFAALDACIEVTRTNDQREWRIAKAKDGEDGKAHPFRLEVVQIGVDEDGDDITSCVVQPDEGSAGSSKKGLPPNSANMRIALDAVSAALKDSHKYGQAGAPAVRPCLPYEAGVTAAADVLPVAEKRRKERAEQALMALVARKHLMHREGWLWLP
ncbi:hypothetical protein AZOA_07330 [Azoarcus sp. Aa7]|nr:hypothetical protein [Azoarcus sp. Aa7]